MHVRVADERVYERRKPVYLGGPSKKGPHAAACGPHQKNHAVLPTLAAHSNGPPYTSRERLVQTH